MTIQEAIELGKTKIDPRNNDLGENPYQRQIFRLEYHPPHPAL